MESTYIPNREPLAPLAFSLLPLGAVKPEGWLRRQLRIQAEGLSGHLDEFWPDLVHSGWLGGAGEAWERGPYYVDGLVPLAYLLEDPRLIAKARRWVDWVLDHQHEDGWLGPIRDRDPHRRAYDAWPVSVMLKALTQYQEATGDGRVVPAMTRFFAFLRDRLAQYPLHEWAHYRWADLVLSIVWLYNRTGERWLLEVAAEVRRQGYDWTDHFTRFRYTERVTEGHYNLENHGVNNAMGLKAPGVWFQFSQAEADRRGVYEALANLDRYHGQVTGVFTCDEHLAGLNPSQGTELCAVVEHLFSLENLITILGDAALADRLEQIAYNALPATFSPDMWAHQYDQQVNQVLCTVAKRNWSNGPDANIFGLEPNYGCCTANMHQGWPKFARSLWMATPEGGLAAVAYAPCRVTATVRGGQQVTVVEETDYPFTDTVRFRLEMPRAAVFPLTFRAPAWCEEAILEAGCARVLPSGEFHTVERLWEPGETYTLHLPMRVKALSRPRGAVALARGPLVFSLKMGEEWRYLRGEPPHADWEVWPTTPWNYGLLVDREEPERSVSVVTRPVEEQPFSPEGAPVLLMVKGRRVPEWTLVDHSAGPPPESPARSAEPVEELTLIPYGSTNLRVTEFPVLEG